MTTQPVLFLHSYGLDAASASWLDVPNLIVPTLPNHGTRRRQRSGLSLEDMVDEIVGWVDRPVHVVGCSMGGILALHLALDHPELVSSLVVACTSSAVRRSIILDRADATAQMTEDEFVTSTMERWFTPSALAESSAPGISYAERSLRAGDRLALADVWRAVAEHDVRDRLRRIDVPTTCVAGSKDVSAPVARLEDLRDGMQAARLVVVDSGHMAYLEHPDAFSAVVREHLAAIAD